MKTLPWFWLLGLILLAVIGWPFLGTTGAADCDKWNLWQDGPHLRGANIYQRRSYPDADGDLAQIAPVIPPYSQADFDKLAAMGANYVNISHPGLYTITPTYTIDLEVQANLDNLLDMAANAQLYVVIAFRTGPGRNEFTFLGEESPGWLGYSKDINFVWPDPNDGSQQDEDQAQAAQAAWADMWRYTANRYKDNCQVVGYDLMVEPNANTRLDIYDPEQFYPAWAGSLYDWNQLYPNITQAIREVDLQTPLLIGGMSYSSIDWLPYLTPTADTRTVYTAHVYDPFIYTHQDPPLNLAYPGVFDADEDGHNDPVNQAWLAARLAPIDAFKTDYNVPVAVNEYGLKRWQPGAAQYMTDMMALLEAKKVNHAWWLWGPTTGDFVEGNHDFNPLFGPNPQNRQEVPTSALLEVIKANWRRNKDNRLFLPVIVKS